MAGAVACFGEMLLHLAPADGGGLADCAGFAVHVGGAEANVAIALAAMGMAARMATVLPANAQGERALAVLTRHGVDVAHCHVRPGRMGAFYTQSARAGRDDGFFYDRAHSAFVEAPADLIDWPTLLHGAAWLHLSGISAALGDAAVASIRRGVAIAPRLGVALSFDCNYRPALWAGRADEARALLLEFARSADLLFAGPADAEWLLGPGKRMTDLRDALPRVRWLAATRRTDAGLGAVLVDRGDGAEIAPVAIDPFVERIGAGDAFAAGLLYALGRGWDSPRALRFAHRACLLKHGVPGDFAAITAAEIIAAGG